MSFALQILPRAERDAQVIFECNFFSRLHMAERIAESLWLWKTKLGFFECEALAKQN